MRRVKCSPLAVRQVEEEDAGAGQGDCTGEEEDIREEALTAPAARHMEKTAAWTASSCVTYQVGARGCEVRAR